MKKSNKIIMGYVLRNKRTERYYVDIISHDSHTAKALGDYSTKIKYTTNIKDAKLFNNFDDAFEILFDFRRLEICPVSEDGNIIITEKK